MSKILLNNVSVDTTSEAFVSQGGVAVINILGDDFGGGVVTVQMTTKNSEVVADPWVNLDDGVFATQSTVKLDYLPVGTLIRVVLEGSTAASNVFCDILQ